MIVPLYRWMEVRMIAGRDQRLPNGRAWTWCINPAGAVMPWKEERKTGDVWKRQHERQRGAWKQETAPYGNQTWWLKLSGEAEGGGASPTSSQPTSRLLLLYDVPLSSVTQENLGFPSPHSKAPTQFLLRSMLTDYFLLWYETSHYTHLALIIYLAKARYFYLDNARYVIKIPTNWPLSVILSWGIYLLCTHTYTHNICVCLMKQSRYPTLSKEILWELEANVAH